MSWFYSAYMTSTGVSCRAASIDRGIFLEAAAAGLRTREVEGTRKAVPGGLEGTVYEVRPSSVAPLIWL